MSGIMEHQQLKPRNPRLETYVIWPMRIVASEINLKVQAASRLRKAAKDAKSSIDLLFSHVKCCYCSWQQVQQNFIFGNEWKFFNLVEADIRKNSSSFT